MATIAITVRCHVLSAAMIRKQYGDAPQLPSTEPAHHLMYAPTASRATMILSDQYATQITIVVDQGLVPALRMQGIEQRWYAYHRAVLFNMVAAVGRAGRSSAWQTIDQSLTLYGLCEDQFPRDVAYKQWQRFMSELGRKNKPFLVQMRQRLAVKPHQKNSPAYQAEATHRVQWILSQYDRLYRSRPKGLEKSLTLHLYIGIAQTSARRAAFALGIAPNTAHSCLRTLRRRLANSVGLRDLVSQAFDLPPLTAS